MSSFGYKQSQRYYNEVPKIKETIHKLTAISITRMDPRGEKTMDRETFMKRPKKYTFTVVTLAPQASTLFQHTYQYDSVKDAEAAHVGLRQRLYDQQVEPYLRKIKNNTRLTCDDKTEILNIFDRISKLRQIE